LCCKKFKTSIQFDSQKLNWLNPSTGVTIEIQFDQDGVPHKKIFKRERISGEKRELYSLKSSVKGVEAFHSELLIENTSKDEFF
jgi:hypothetical protein